MIFDQCHVVWRAVAIKPNTCEPIPVKDWKRYVDDVFNIIPKGNRNKMLPYLNSIDPHIKFTIEQPNEEGGIPFLDTFPKPSRGRNCSLSI